MEQVRTKIELQLLTQLPLDMHVTFLSVLNLPLKFAYFDCVDLPFKYQNGF